MQRLELELLQDHLAARAAELEVEEGVLAGGALQDGPDLARATRRRRWPPCPSRRATPGISPRLRSRRFAFFPVSVRLSAATTISGIFCTPTDTAILDEQTRDRRLLVDVPDGLAEQLARWRAPRSSRSRASPAASGMESVTMSLESGLFSIRSMACPESTAWRARGQHLARPRRLDGLRHLGQGARGVDDVVHDEGGAALHVADDVVHLGHVRLVAALVHDGEGWRRGAWRRRARARRRRRRARPRSRSRRLSLLHVLDDDGRGEEVVHGHVEEALDLRGVQVHGEHAVGARGRRGGRPPAWPRSAPAACPCGPAARSRSRGCTAVMPRGARALEGVEHDQQLHQVLVHRRAGGLHHEHVGPAHVVLDLEPDLAVAEAGQVGAPEGTPR